MSPPTRASPTASLNEQTTVRQFKAIMADPDNPLRSLYAARIMREGRVRDLWAFLSPQEASVLWPRVEPHLGRRRHLWRYLLDTWRQAGAIE
jgi:hypothetical protein